MKIIKTRYLSGTSLSVRAYTYKVADDLRPGDMVLDKRGSKMVIVDEPVDEEWLKSYGGDNLAVAERVPTEESECSNGN